MQNASSTSFTVGIRWGFSSGPGGGMVMPYRSWIWRRGTRDTSSHMGGTWSRRCARGSMPLHTISARVATKEGNTRPGQSHSVTLSVSSSVWKCRVLPGVELTATRRPWWLLEVTPSSTLMREDLPTLGYPTMPMVSRRRRGAASPPSSSPASALPMSLDRWAPAAPPLRLSAMVLAARAMSTVGTPFTHVTCSSPMSMAPPANWVRAALPCPPRAPNLRRPLALPPRTAPTMVAASAPRGSSASASSTSPATLGPSPSSAPSSSYATSPCPVGSENTPSTAASSPPAAARAADAAASAAAASAAAAARAASAAAASFSAARAASSWACLRVDCLPAVLTCRRCAYVSSRYSVSSNRPSTRVRLDSPSPSSCAGASGTVGGATAPPTPVPAMGPGGAATAVAVAVAGAPESPESLAPSSAPAELAPVEALLSPPPPSNSCCSRAPASRYVSRALASASSRSASALAEKKRKSMPSPSR